MVIKHHELFFVISERKHHVDKENISKKRFCTSNLMKNAVKIKTETVQSQNFNIVDSFWSSSAKHCPLYHFKIDIFVKNL